MMICDFMLVLVSDDFKDFIVSENISNMFS